MNELNSIYLRRKNKLVLGSSNGKLESTHIATILKNIESIGYTLAPQLLERLATLSVSEASLFYSQLLTDLKQAVGANVTQAPMYPNFPAQVMEMTKAELYINAIMHYLGTALGERILPQYEIEKRSPLADNLKLKIIHLGTEAELFEIFRNLLSANTSLSATDKQDLTAFIATFPSFTTEILPAEIRYKENLAFISSLLLQHCEHPLELLLPYFKTATDVLRLATAMSEGDISLAENTRFNSFSRRERRFLLGLLERCGSITEDMLRHPKKWIRLGERLHPGEYAKRFPKATEGFDAIRNNKPVATFNRRLEAAFAENRWRSALELLVTRPGELARRLDFLLRNSDEPKILELFQQVNDRIATAVLIQVSNHFQHRNSPTELRIFFPKGNVAKAYAIENQLPALEPNLCQQVVEICDHTLISRFAQLPPLGKVYINPALKNFPVPLTQRSASKSLRQLARCSRLPMPVGDTIRFFIWWREGLVNGSATGDVDLDLSAVLYDANWSYLEHVSYTNLKSSKYQSAHSGDLTSAPNGASEFIDLNIPSILSYGGRYVVASVLSFSQQPFCNLPECFAGWMMRHDAGSGEIYEPTTVLDKVDLTANTTVTVPAILDLATREVIWTDLSLSRAPNWRGIPNNMPNNVENAQKGMVLIGKAMSELQPPTLERLFQLHTSARGERVKDSAAAETIFDVDCGITPFDVATISAQFLA